MKDIDILMIITMKEISDRDMCIIYLKKFQ